MLVELSKAQDIEAGDGTTSVVVLCGSMLNQCQKLLSKGIHPTHITEAFQSAAAKAEEVSLRCAGWRWLHPATVHMTLARDSDFACTLCVALPPKHRVCLHGSSGPSHLAGA